MGHFIGGMDRRRQQKDEVPLGIAGNVRVQAVRNELGQVYHLARLASDNHTGLRLPLADFLEHPERGGRAEGEEHHIPVSNGHGTFKFVLIGDNPRGRRGDVEQELDRFCLI